MTPARIARCLRLPTVWSLFCLALGAPGAEPELRPEDVPHFPAIEPAKALDTFQIRPGFKLELAAHEPEVMDPIAVSFDAQGRAYVLEMRDYSERRPERLGRVRRLEDRDADGRFETSVVFLDDLPWPTALTCWNGGVFVGATPDVIYARDDNGDGRADVREAVFTGFAVEYAPYATNKLNVQAMLNSFQWGVDARIHGASGLIGGRVQRVDSEFTRAWRRNGGVPEARIAEAPAAVDVRGRDFSFDPRTLELRLETGGGQYGMTFDDDGRKFLCSNSDHLQVVRIEDRYVARNAWHALPPARVSIAADGPAAEVFRISPEEPWRVIRTRWRVTGLVPGIIEGGGRSSGYFTSATGLTLYRGDAYGPEYAGDAFVADCGSNLVHRKKLVAQGCEFSGVRPADETRREFIACSDTWFRPVQFVNAPDGCLWIIDMYREIIEHPWSLPPNLKRLLDLNSGNDRGRLYRIAPADRPVRRRAPDLGAASDAELARFLAHPNAWHRDTASRLLVERGTPGAAAAARAALAPQAPEHWDLSALHALHVLHALGQLNEADLLPALRHESPAVRRHAVQLTEVLLGDREPSPALAERLVPGPTEDPHVRLQLAFSLGSLRHPRRTTLLADLLRSARPDAGEGLIADAVLASAGDAAPELFRSLAAPESAAAPTTARALADLAELLARRQRPDEIREVLQALGSLPRTPENLLPVARFAAGLRRSGTALPSVDPDQRLAPWEAFARDLATRADAPVARRLDAIRILGQRPTDASRAALRGLLSSGQAVELQRAAVEELLRGDVATGPDDVLPAWPALAGPARELVGDTLLRRTSGTRILLETVASRRIALADLTATQLAALRGHADVAIRQRALDLLGKPSASRHEAVAAALPALNLRGDATRGLAVYQAQCATCHRLAGAGFALGPDLESIKSQPKEKLLVAIVDPNREVAPAFLATTLETTDNESYTGLAGAETAAGFVLRQANGVEQRIPRAQIRSVRPEGVSIMPEGFETTIPAQGMADLLALLTGQP